MAGIADVLSVDVHDVEVLGAEEHPHHKAVEDALLGLFVLHFRQRRPAPPHQGGPHDQPRQVDRLLPSMDIVVYGLHAAGPEHFPLHLFV